MTEERGIGGVPPWVLHFDGLTEPVNPGGVSTFGFEVRRGDDVVHAEHGLVSPPGPGSTNNVAEYEALIRGLEWLAARDLEGEPVLAYGDSQLVVEQVAGRWRAQKDRIAELHARARKLMDALGAELTWVPREENEAANRLTEEAYAEWTARHPEWIVASRSQPASQRQRARMAELGLPVPDSLDRREAARLIDTAERERRRAERAAGGGPG